MPYIEITGTTSNYSASPSSSNKMQSPAEQQIDDNNENASDLDMSIEVIDSNKEFSVPASQKRREEQKTKDYVSRKILKALDNIDKPMRHVEQSSVRQFFSKKFK